MIFLVVQTLLTLSLYVICRTHVWLMVLPILLKMANPCNEQQGCMSIQVSTHLVHASKSLWSDVLAEINTILKGLTPSYSRNIKESPRRVGPPHEDMTWLHGDLSF